jgi:hypothetical protein
MLSDPLNRVMLGYEALDYSRFAIGPQNIHLPARSGIFPRQESWSLLEHPLNNAPVTARFKTVILPDQTNPLPETLEGRSPGLRESLVKVRLAGCNGAGRSAPAQGSRRCLSGGALTSGFVETVFPARKSA